MLKTSNRAVLFINSLTLSVIEYHVGRHVNLLEALDTIFIRITHNELVQTLEGASRKKFLVSCQRYTMVKVKDRNYLVTYRGDNTVLLKTIKVA